MPTAVETIRYWFYEDGVTQNIATINQQHEQGIDMEQRIRAVIQPLVDGAFVGESAQSFFNESEIFLNFARETNEQLQNLSNNLNRAMQTSVDMMNAIDAITNE
jgi:uncharacterized protein YukE